jgi:hypothetical protein
MVTKSVSARAPGAPSAEILWSAPINRGWWHTFLFHVRWSNDPNQGFVHLCHSITGHQYFRSYLPLTYRRTMFEQANYLKQGLYRDNMIQQVGIVYHDGMETLESRSLGVLMPVICPERFPLTAVET